MQLVLIDEVSHLAVLLTDRELYTKPFRLAAPGLLVYGYDG
jgi:hypothetical protein